MAHCIFKFNLCIGSNRWHCVYKCSSVINLELYLWKILDTFSHSIPSIPTWALTEYSPQSHQSHTLAVLYVILAITTWLLTFYIEMDLNSIQYHVGFNTTFIFTMPYLTENEANYINEIKYKNPKQCVIVMSLLCWDMENLQLALFSSVRL